MKALWAVTSCPRPGMPEGYLPDFVRQWDAAWRGRARRPVLARFVDERLMLGQAINFLRVLRFGLEMGAEIFHTFEDDVRACPGAFQRVARQPLPEWAAFGTWFSPLVAPGTPNGWAKADVMQFYGLQAVTFTRAAALAIVDYQARDPWPTRNGGDSIPGRALGKGRLYARHVPDLFDHTGEVSLCNPGHGLTGARVSVNFVQALDARRLGVYR